MKRIVFLIIASLMVLGLVLPGCGTPTPPANVIKIAVCGPLTDIQGQDHLSGAQMAVSQINGAGGVVVGNTTYTIQLVPVETYESTTGVNGIAGTTNLLAQIDNVAFVVGGFRTEAVVVYREVAMNASKLFINCGAATASLQASVMTNYNHYKYWFKATPYNEVYLVKSMLKMTATICGVFNATLAQIESGNATYVKDAYKISLAGGKPRVQIIAESASWCAGIVTIANSTLPLLGYNVTGVSLVGVQATQSDLDAVLSAADAAFKPHIYFTAFSGASGASYSAAKAAGNYTGLTIGINVPGQQKAAWANTNGKCEGEIMLDTWAENVSNTPGTVAWFNSFMSMTGRYPGYTAATYDAVYSLKDAVEALDTLNSTLLVPYFEAMNRTTGVGTVATAVYPLPGTTDSGVPCLTQSQKEALYGTSWAYCATEWRYTGGAIVHDTVYGPNYQTGIGSQWQLVGGLGKKVGIWPIYLDSPSKAYWDTKLTDQYGNWNFAYPGTKKYILPIGGMLNIPWNPYA